MPDVTETAATAPELDHLGALHRMSRTAGLGSSDYSAVNVAAVVAVLIGAASALALVSRVFLILPVIGVIVAALAVVQIRKSNGTQTGFGLAVLALVLTFGISAVSGVQYLREVAQEKNDTAAINDLMQKFGGLLAAEKYDEAYAQTDPRFRDQTTLAVFKNAFGQLSTSPNLGRLTGFRTNNLFQIETDPESQRRIAVGTALMDTEKLKGDQAVRLDVRYRNNGNAWAIYAMPQIFKGDAAAGASGGGAGGAGGGAAGPAGPPAPR